MWQRLPDLIFDVVNHQSININNVVYIIGGYRNSASPKYEKISVYTITKNSYCALMSTLKTYDWHCMDNTINQSEDSTNPIDRYGHTVVTWKQAGILFGGCHDNGYCEPDIYLFIPDGKCGTIFNFDVCENKERWIRVTGIGGNAPLRRDGHSTAVLGDHMFIYGGLVVSRPRYYDNKLYQLDLNSWQWSVVYHGEYLEPLGRDFCHLLPHNHELYLLGGRSDSCFQGNTGKDIYDTAIWKFGLHQRTNLRSWEKIHPGYGIICESVLESHQNIADRHCTIMAACPQPRRSFMAAILKDEIVMFGGLYQNEDFSVHFNDVWTFNIYEPRWTCLSSVDISEQYVTSVPAPLRKGSLTKLNNHCLLLVGGVTTDNTTSIQFSRIIGKSLSFPVNARPCDYNLIDGNCIIEKTNNVSQVPVTMYHTSHTSFSGHIAMNDDLMLRSTAQVFLFRPQLSLYQKALAVVVNFYTPQELRKCHIPPAIIWDIESIRISPDS